MGIVVLDPSTVSNRPTIGAADHGHVACGATVGSWPRRSANELRNDSGKIMRGLDAGETFTVTRNGTPVGELTPLRRHRYVAAEAAIEFFASAPAIDYDHLRADLDALADQDIAPRG